MAMDRWNSINPLVEGVAGRMARAHLNNELHQLKAAAGNKTQEAMHLNAVTVMARYVGALYGISVSDVLSLSMRDVEGENVEPGGRTEPQRVTEADVEAVLGSPETWGAIADVYHVTDGWLIHDPCGTRVVQQVTGPDRLAGLSAVTAAVAAHTCEAKP